MKNPPSEWRRATNQNDIARTLGYQDGAALTQRAAEALWHYEEKGPWPGDTDETEAYLDEAAYVFAFIAAGANQHRAD